jgi:uncharacterized membrane protein YeaQ/YmgE (transglycosylase-associated protein family)
VLFSLWGIIVFLLVGLIAGYIANAVMGRQSRSLLMNLLLGVAGSFIGSLIFQIFGFYSTGGILPMFIVATIGAIVLLWLGRMLSGKQVRF